MVDDVLQIPSSASTSSPTTSSCHSALYLPEILAKIMNFAIYRPDTSRPNRWSRTPFTSKKNPPWLFMAVSKFWRSVAVSTPWLWSTFIAQAPYRPTYRAVEDLPRMFEVHSMLGHQEPLTLEMYWSGEISRDAFDKDPSIIMRSLLIKMLMRQNRWEDVRLYMAMRLDRLGGTPASPDPAHFTFRLDKMVMVKRLDIDICAEPHPRSGKLVVRLGPAPLLETLSIGESTRFDTLLLKSSPTADMFPRLTTISLSPKFFDQYFYSWKLLESTPHVEKLSLKCGQHFIQPRRMIALPKLRHLVMRFDVVRPEAFLQKCYTPSLRILELKECKDLLVNLRNALQPLSLTELSLEVYRMGPYDTVYLMDFLHSVAGLRRLRLDDQTPAFPLLLTNLAITLHPEASSEPLLSKLASLELGIRSSSFFDEKMSCSIAFVRNIVLACRRKFHAGFHFSISISRPEESYPFRDTPPVVYPAEDVEEMLCNDSEILECLSKNFAVTVNRRVLST
ncbi:hypothetical protein SCHPADRAFT_927877 [Schizopora paradoxa]|uniref:F-box domain-containing protein n=1 Tax=Schizopora paradoxa TaxID=27342 RepID=A0A0H2RQW6_9AGAM|nr:hypothetical protein SCHPADRAFT_927877 [Schizopora paradoxa]